MGVILLALAFSGCTSLRVEKVRATMDKGDVTACTFLGDVSGYKYMRAAADLGADVVLVHSTALGKPTKGHPFKAYDCAGKYAKK